MKKLYLLLIILIMPVFVYAESFKDYTSADTEAKSYLPHPKGDFVNTYANYIKCDLEGSKCNAVKFLDSETFYSSKGKSGRTYLYDGTEYWTESSGTKGYVVNNSRELYQTLKTSRYNVRPVVIVKSNVKVLGNGTMGNPWKFENMYKVQIIVDQSKATISSEGGDTQYVTRGSSAEFKVGVTNPNSGYMYITNDCNARYENGYLTIPGVRRNITCNVSFGTGKFKVDLVDATPRVAYLKYRDNFYKNTEYKDTLLELTTIPTRSGYDFLGYKHNNIMVVNPDKTINRVAANHITSDLVLTPSYKIRNPQIPTIGGNGPATGGGGTKVYGHEPIKVTCTNPTRYDSLTKIIYAFGYSTSDGGNPTVWSNNQENNNEYDTQYMLGKLYYTCRVYATDGTYTSDTVYSSTSQDVEVEYVNARVDFDANGGTLSGSSTLYTQYNSPSFFAGRTSSTTSTLPTVTKTGYTFNGWYTSSSGGSQVIASNGTIQANVSSWTNAARKFIITDTSNASGAHKLYAQYSANQLAFANQTITKTFSTSAQTANVTGATNGTGTYTYSEVSEKQGSTNTSKITISSAGVITISASTPAATYTYVIRATDSNSAATTTATYTITINKANSTAPTLTARTYTYNGTSQCLAKSGGTSGLTQQFSYRTWDGSKYSNWTSWSENAGTICSTNAGQWEIKARSLGNGNYNTSGDSAAVVLKVNKANATPPNFTAKTFTYDGASHCLGKTNGTSGLTEEYSYRTWNGSKYSDWTSWSTNTGTYCSTNAGQWEIKARSVGNSNYNTVESSAVVLKVNKANSTAPKLTAKEVTYNGSKHCVGESGGTTGLTREYSYCTWNGTSCGSWSSWTTSTDAKCSTNVGQWKIRARSVGNSNYNTSSASTEVLLKVNTASFTAYVCNISGVKIRNGAGNSAAQVCVVGNGRTVTVIGEGYEVKNGTSYKWYKIQDICGSTSPQYIYSGCAPTNPTEAGDPNGWNEYNQKCNQICINVGS